MNIDEETKKKLILLLKNTIISIFTNLIRSYNKLVKRKTSKLKDISFKTVVTSDMIERTLDNLRDYYEEQTACEEFITTEDVLNIL